MQPGWSKKQDGQNAIKEEANTEVQRQDVKGSAKRSTWARLINKIYGINLPDRDVQMQAEPWMVEACLLSVGNADLK